MFSSNYNHANPIIRVGIQQFELLKMLTQTALLHLHSFTSIMTTNTKVLQLLPDILILSFLTQVFEHINHSHYQPTNHPATTTITQSPSDDGMKESSQ